MADLWRRNEEDPFTYRRDDGTEAKGVAPPILHIRYNIIGVNSEGDPLVEYLFAPLVEHYYDSHGQLDHMRGYSVPRPNVPPGTLRGVVTKFVSAVRCLGTSLYWTVQEWLLVPGTTKGCETFSHEVSQREEWFRQTVNPGQYLSPDGVPAKGVAYDLIMLNFEIVTVEGVELHTTIPICNPYNPDVKARAGIVFDDSHGQIDEIVGIHQEGPKTKIVLQVYTTQLPCPPPKIGIMWRVYVQDMEVVFHPGSRLLSQVDHAMNCCQCCEEPPNPCCNPPGCSNDDCCTSTNCCVATATLMCGEGCDPTNDCDLVFWHCCENFTEGEQPAGCEYLVSGNRCEIQDGWIPCSQPAPACPVEQHPECIDGWWQCVPD